MISAGDFKNGITIEMDGAIWQIIEFQHVKPGKGAAFVRTKLKNIVSGGVVEKSFRPTEKFPLAHIDKKDCQYLYQDGDFFNFMDNETFDQIAALHKFKYTFSVLISPGRINQSKLDILHLTHHFGGQLVHMICPKLFTEFICQFQKVSDLIGCDRFSAFLLIMLLDDFLCHIHIIELIQVFGRKHRSYVCTRIQMNHSFSSPFRVRYTYN